MRLFKSRLWLVLACLVLMFVTVQAKALVAPPSGDVILRVTGNISWPNAGDEARFDRAALKRLPWRTIETRMPWLEGVNRFTGPRLSALLKAVGAQGKNVRIGALNGFEADVPISDFENFDVILAMYCNGVPMSVRNFGPLFVVYPFDDYPQLQTEAIRFRSVWQVDRIHVY